MKKACLTIFLLSVVLSAFSAEKLFFQIEDGFNEYLKNDFHRLALSLSQKYDIRLSAIQEKGVEPVLKITKEVSDDKKYDTILFAIRGNLFFVNEENPVTDLSLEEMQQILSGTYYSWKKNKARIRQICYTGSEKMVPSNVDKAVLWVRFKEPYLALQMVSYDATSVGILPLKEAVLKVKGTKLLTVNGVAAIPRTVMDGTYPASVRYYLSIHRNAPAEVRKIYKELRSKQTKLKLLNAGILPVDKGD